MTMALQLNGPGHNQSMSNFGLFLFLLRFAYCLACELQIDRKTFLCIFFFLGWFSLLFNLFTSDFLCCSFVEGETKEAFCVDKRTHFFNVF